MERRPMIFIHVTRLRRFFETPESEVKAFINEDQFAKWRANQLNTNRGRLTLTRLTKQQVDSLDIGKKPHLALVENSVSLR